LRTLPNVTPTPEQLAIISRNRPGTEVIRGAAGSGKTTTALLRLRSLIGMFLSRKRRQQRSDPVRVLVLTYNRTLRGYIKALADRQVDEANEIALEISTFGRWAMTALGNPTILDDKVREAIILHFSTGISMTDKFLLEEVEYAMGRFMPEKLENYLSVKREGRGLTPRVDRPLRESILNNVIRPYQQWKINNGTSDWNDLAVNLAVLKMPHLYEIVIADETQDFSANQIRAIKNQLAPEHALTLVIDTAQRIYPRGFTWQEAGITVRPENSRRLERNYRNTIEIARFALSLIDGIPVDEDSTMPDFSKCENHGPLPIVLKGRFSEQVRYVIGYIRKEIDLEKESVAVLHPLGGGWFKYIKDAFESAGFDYVEITRQSEWPEGKENIAFSTLHSAKGLEFDHVVIIGIDAEVTPNGTDQGDDRFTKLRRLLAMGIGRARFSVVLGSKPEDESRLIHYLDESTYREVIL